MLPAEIPDAHSFETKTANIVLIEGPLSAPVQDGGGVQKNAGRCQKMLDAPRPARRHLSSAEALPGTVGPRRYDPHLLHARISIDDYKDLRAFDCVAAGADCGLGTLDPLLLALWVVSDQPGNFLPKRLTKA